MTTLVLQSVFPLLLVVFSVVAIVIARRIRELAPSHSDAWLVTGLVLGTCALSGLVQGVWAIAAYAAGAGTGVYERYLVAAPVLNHGRTFLLFVLYAFLALIALRGRLHRFGLGALAVCGVAALLAGGVYGHQEGGLQAFRHYPATAVIDTAAFIVLAAVLLVLLSRNVVDRLLWFALACMGIQSIIAVLFLIAAAWVDVPGSWSPPFWMIHAMRLFFIGVMVALAVTRYRAARAGVPVAGLLSRREQYGMRLA